MRADSDSLREAALWHRLEGETVRCDLCYRLCEIQPGERGECCVRENREGRLFTLTYGRLVSASVDPIEKKPLFHFHPGSRSLSVATVGCNFKCAFCQNWTIAHWAEEHPGEPLPGDAWDPEEIARAAEDRGCASISYTYTEPTVFWELVRDTGDHAHERGIANVLVTNGYMTREALDWMGDRIDAANVDFKGMRAEAIEPLTGARPGPVKRNIARMRERSIWVEVTTLVIPGVNDSEAELADISRMISEIDPDIPWHVSRFHPAHKLLDHGPTPSAVLQRACDLGKEAGLRYVYTGNLHGDDNESTFCPGCGAQIMERRGFGLGRVQVKDGRCARCNAPVAGVALP